MKLKITEYEKALFPVPFREWAKIFRWAYFAATIVAFVWVFRLDLDCMPGASLRPSHPARTVTRDLTPRGGVAGYETWILPEYRLCDADTLALYIENYLPDQRRIALGAPELTVSTRMKYALGPFVQRPPLRLLLGDDPPAERLKEYATWVDELADHNDIAAREHVRGFLRFAANFSKTLSEPDNDRLLPNYTSLFSNAVWREQGNHVIVRLGKLTGADSVAPLLHPAAGTVTGTAITAHHTRNRLLWLLPALLLALLFALWNEYRRDPTGWKCILTGILGTGIWSLAAWDWFLSNLDPVTWMLLPLPFYAGIYLARKVREIGAGRDPEAEFSKLYYTWHLPIMMVLGGLLVSGLILTGVTGKILLLLAGIEIGLIITQGWCITEDFLAPKQYRAAPRNQEKRYKALIFAIPAIGWFMQPYLPVNNNTPFQPLFPHQTEDTVLVENPFWVGPLNGATASNFLVALKNQIPDAEIYNPVVSSPRELSKDERDWFRPTHSLPLFGTTFQYTEDELEIERMNILGGWGLAVDRIDNLVKQNAQDTLLNMAWEAELHEGVVQKVTQELSNPHLDWSPPKSSNSFEASNPITNNAQQEWRLLAFDQLERAAHELRFSATEMLHRNPKTVGGDWFDGFNTGNGETIAVVYTRDTTALRTYMHNFLPAVRLAGPGMLLNAEKDSLRLAGVIGFILLSIWIAASIQKRWWISICSVVGVATGTGIAIFCGISLAAVLTGGLTGLAFLLALRNNKSAIGLGVLLLPVPAAAFAATGIVVLLGGIIRMLGNAE